MGENTDMSTCTERSIWEQELIRRRRSERLQGWILVSIGGIGLLALLFTLVTSFPRVFTLGPLFEFMSLLFVLCFFCSFLLGISTLRAANKTPTEKDVARVRQMERTRLYQEAQGVLPWTYRRAGRICMTILGCVALVGGVLVLLSFGAGSPDGWVMVAAGVVFLCLTLYIIPRDRRRLPEQSAQTLAREMIAGESSDAVQTERD